MTDYQPGAPLTEHPSAEDVAAYLSERMAPDARAALEEHLADCRECRQLVTSARRLLRSHRTPNRLVWMVPTAAAAVLAIAVLARTPGGPPEGEPLRSDPGAAGPESALTIPVVSPSEGQTLTGPPIVFVWHAQAGQPLYRLSLIEASGRQVWSGETTDTTLPVPANVSLDRGRTYFWTVDALAADGRSMTTRTKRFAIAP